MTPPMQPGWLAPASWRRGRPGGPSLRSCGAKGWGRDIAAALDQIDSDDEDTAALALARKKLSATRHLPWEVRRRRTAAMLGRKGYSREAAVRALEAAFAEEPD